MKYEMIEAGTHEEGGKLYKQGNLVESKNALDQLFPSRFRKAGVQGSFRLGINSEPEPAAKRELEVSSLGDNISDEFPEAAKKDLKVYKDGKHYKVADADDVQNALDNNNLTSKAKVEAFIAEYTG